jgi:hypothetical protein
LKNLKTLLLVFGYLKPIIAGRGRYYELQDYVFLNEPEVDNSYK